MKVTILAAIFTAAPDDESAPVPRQELEVCDLPKDEAELLIRIGRARETAGDDEKIWKAAQKAAKAAPAPAPADETPPPPAEDAPPAA